MKSLRAFILGLAVFSLCASLAPANAQVEADGGLYVGMRGGLSQMRSNAYTSWSGYPATYITVIDPITGASVTVVDTYGLNDHIEERALEMDYGWVAGLSLGYTVLFPENSADLRFELEGIYRRNDNGNVESQYYATTNNPDSLSYPSGYTNVAFNGFVEVRSAMFNMLADFHTPTRFTPYFGLGAGMSQVLAEGDIGGATFDDNVFALSWQAIAGVGYKLSPGTMLTMEFRYFKLATDRYVGAFGLNELRNVKFDDWSMGVRFTF